MDSHAVGEEAVPAEGQDVVTELGSIFKNQFQPCVLFADKT
jgi:hypothetical protein